MHHDTEGIDGVSQGNLAAPAGQCLIIALRSRHRRSYTEPGLAIVAQAFDDLRPFPGGSLPGKLARSR